MKILDLYKVWEILNKLCHKENSLNENSVYVQLLGNRSNYSHIEFDNFLSYYSFKLEDNTLIIFNDDAVPWENFTVGDFSRIPISILEMSDGELDSWIDLEVNRQLEQQKLEKSAWKEGIKQQIENLQKQLENL